MELNVCQNRVKYLGFALLLAVALPLAGCSDQAQISTYTAPRQLAPQDRMLAAIVPHGGRGWFFKLTGRDAIVQAEKDRFTGFVKSVTFSEAGEPGWTLPAGWTNASGGGPGRFATIEVPTKSSILEVTVTVLEWPADQAAESALRNVNRWRGQMGLSPITTEQMPAEVEQAQVGEASATLVNLVGHYAPGSMSPVAQSSPSPPAPNAAGQGAGGPVSGGSTRAAAAGKIKYVKPDGWGPGELTINRGGIQINREAAFVVKDGDRQIEVTITPIAAIPDALLANANRWRGQIGLPPVESTEQLGASAIEVAGISAHYVVLKGAQETILGVLAAEDGQAWAVKLVGDSHLAERERERFETFVRSIRFAG